MSQESVLGLQAVAENALENGRWPSDEPETLNGSSHGHEHDDIEEEDEHQMVDGELELADGEDATVKVTRKAGPPPMIDTEVAVGGPSPTSVVADGGGASPAGSTRSLPTVVEPHRPGTPAAQSAQAASFSQASLESARTQLSRRTNDNNPPPSPSRRHLHTRSTPASEPTRSPNRLSGFFTNLIHRNVGPVPPSPLGSTQGERAATPAEDSANPSRSSSPAPPPRPATPPPPLPPPSLQELGLSLSVLTNDLSPSHFSTPPASGAFLAPHYLLLCHAQGLDVLPLVSPPAPQPYALIRRVPFKSVVVMEHRGVLVAIAGRRDGVRVYALDEVKKAVEWRLDVEIRREKDRQRRDELKRGVALRDSMDKRSAELPVSASNTSNARIRRASSMVVPQRTPGKKPKSHTTPPAPVPSRPITPPTLATPPSIPPIPNPHVSRPPSYRSPSPPPRLEPPPAISIGARRSSVTNVLGGVARTNRPNPSEDLTRTTSEKAEWLEGSDEEEAINVMTAGPSGSQALDERTSAMASATTPTMPTGILATPRPSAPTLSPATSATLTPTQGRRRPPDLQLEEAQRSPGRPAPPSPTPTLLTLQQALMASPLPARGPLAHPTDGEPSDGDDDGEASGSRTPTNDRLTFGEMLMESRIPDLPPPGTRVPQEAMMLTHSHGLASGDDDSSLPGSPTASAQSIHTARSRASQDTTRSAGTSLNASSRRRRRWSVLDGIFATSPTQAGSTPEQTASPTTTEAPPLPSPSPALVPPPRPSTASSASGIARERRTGVLQRASSSRRPSSAGGRSASASIGGRSTASVGGRSSSVSAAAPQRPATAGGAPGASSDVPPVPTPPTRFLSRLLGGAFHHSRRSEDSGGDGATPEAHHKGERKSSSTTAQQAPAPKLEYVKLPGTKGALLIKAVETNKKSFLAILCGDNGGKTSRP